MFMIVCNLVQIKNPDQQMYMWFSKGNDGPVAYCCFSHFLDFLIVIFCFHYLFGLWQNQYLVISRIKTI